MEPVGVGLALGGGIVRRVLVVTLPLPTRELSPNASSPGAWRRKAKAKKKYREDAYIAAIRVGAKNLKPLDAATVQCHFYFRDNRRRDGDNFLACMKSAFDGLVDAGVFADDNGLTHLPITKSVDKKDPRVEVRIYQET